MQEYDLKMTLESKESKIFVETVKIAERITSVSSSFQVVSNKKRHLSLPGEGSVKKSKSDKDSTRDIRKVKCVLYTKHSELIDSECSESVTAENQNSDTVNNESPSSKQVPEMQKRKIESKDKKDKGRKGASNCSDSMAKGENSSIDSLLKAFKAMETRYSSMEERVEKTFGDLEKIFQSKIDKFENHVIQKFTETMNTAISTLK